MSWKEHLQPASYRGVAFKVNSHTISGGRRIQETERYQQRTVTSDMGPILPKFSISAYVIQGTDNDFDYFNARDKLLDVLQNPPKKQTDHDSKLNVGILIHPYFGKRRVHVAEYSIQELYSEGGIARFDITFVLEEDELFPGKITEPSSKMDATGLKVAQYAMDNFFRIMNNNLAFVEGLGNDAVYAMSKIQQGLNNVNNVVKSSLATASRVVQSAIETMTSVLNEPCALFNTVQSAAESFGYLAGMMGSTVQGGVVGGCSGTVRGEQITLNGVTIPEKLGASIVIQMIQAQDFDEIDLETGPETQEDNRALLINITKLLLLAYCCKIFSRINFSSRQQLYTYLEKLLDALDDFLLRLGSQVDIDVTDMYLGAESLRAEIASLMLNKVETLQNEITYTAGNTGISTLELAYNLYEDTDRCSEIFDKNKITIKHPGFVPGNTDISVLEA